MALRLYHDSAATQEITAANPDTVHKPVLSGQTMTDEKGIYVKSDDATLTYENIVIDGIGDNDGATASGQVDVLYALDNAGVPGAYAQTLTLPSGAYTAATLIWRKVVAPAVSAAFKRVDISHQISADEYVA